ncbi:hypothetical protein NAT51_19195 [Flavobacterium amniphilum]|uniref:hypothetical protein n=1 Tax=Flavobacterium amniphilum TaxID=1834035 RepID=UPI00202A53E4|nr:hypothetical protein [Flavobacterium amniphilum]MCL9807657.1 hypothetical protein [Flavobacterium amniphilum]
MQSNEHNPIAVRIGKISKLWANTRDKRPQGRFFQVICNQEDFILVNGFIQIEASEHGKSNDSFLMFSVDFDNESQFLTDFINEWFTAFDRDLEKYPNWHWEDFERLKKDYRVLPDNNPGTLNKFLTELLVSFKKFEAKKENLIIIGLVPKKVSDNNSYNSFLKKTITSISNDYGLMVIDFYGKEKHTELVSDLDLSGAQILVPDQNMAGSYKELATQGNPNNPQVKFRKCLFEIGESAAENNRKQVHYWGKQMLDVTQSTGDRSFWASAHLIYAGFLFQFKDDDSIFKLLDKGIRISEAEYKNNKQAAGTLMQLYSYKASYYSIIGKKDEAVQNFVKQSQIAEDVEMIEQMILANIYALLVIKNENNDLYKKIITKSFQKGYLLSDGLLKVINFAFITERYLDLDTHEITFSEKLQIEDRMKSIYGNDWREYAKKISSTMKPVYENQ